MLMSIRKTLLLLLLSQLMAAVVFAQTEKPLANEREKSSYMVGMDVGVSLTPAGNDIDLAAFEKSMRNSLDGKELSMPEALAQTTTIAVMQRMQARKAGTLDKAPPVDRAAAGTLAGFDVGSKLAPIRDEIDIATFMRGLRAGISGGKSVLDEAELTKLRQTLTERLQKRASEQASRNDQAGAAFLASNKQKKGVITTRSGLQYQVIRAGSGERPLPGSKVKVNYEGRLPDGTVFDSSYQRGEPADFPLTSVIPGWREGVTLMPVGAKYRFWVPGELAYGKRGSPPQIGPNQVLVFDVELMEILK